MQTFVTHLECGLEGDHYPADTVQTLSAAGKPLLVRYNLDALGDAVDRDEHLLLASDGGLYRACRDRRSREWFLLAVED